MPVRLLRSQSVVVAAAYPCCGGAIAVWKPLSRWRLAAAVSPCCILCAAAVCCCLLQQLCQHVLDLVDSNLYCCVSWEESEE